MAINMHVVKNGAAITLSFPDFEEGTRLGELAEHVAAALHTITKRPVGTPLERLVGFHGYPDQFALWWDGFVCELGYSEPCSVEMQDVTQQLVDSGAFRLHEAEFG